MAKLADTWIRQMAQNEEMITPFAETKEYSHEISYGLSSCGYDFRLEYEYIDLRNIYTSGWNALGKPPLDPKTVNEVIEAYKANTAPDPHNKFIILYPNTSILGSTVEYFKMPNNVVANCTGKSTYARLGIYLNTTPIEPGWEGNITLCISNLSPNPVRLHPQEGIGQIQFEYIEGPVEKDYEAKGGNYQQAKGIVGGIQGTLNVAGGTTSYAEAPNSTAPHNFKKGTR